MQGIQGIPGLNGTNGIDGLNGTNGIDGTSWDVTGPYLYDAGNNTAAFNASALPQNLSEFNNDVGFITGYNETDPVFVASPAYLITVQNITDWNTAYSWGNHALIGYLTNYTETDPIFSSSPAYNITNTNITDWNTAYSWGNHSDAGYLTSTGNQTINGNLTIQGTDNCVELPGGGKLCGNTTCTVLYSPNGQSKLEVCN